MRWIFLLFIPLLSFTTQASQEYACVQYQRANLSWGDWYRIPVIEATGSELNNALETSQYNAWDKYVLGTWPNGGYSLFKLPNRYSSIGFTNLRTTDQSGRTYHIRKPNTFGSCPSF